VAIVTQTLEESKGITKVDFRAESETFLIEADGDFKLTEVSEKIRLAGKKHDEQIGAEGRNEWVVEVIR
jgi:copper chaperone CopZ